MKNLERPNIIKVYLSDEEKMSFLFSSDSRYRNPGIFRNPIQELFYILIIFYTDLHGQYFRQIVIVYSI